jgi:hypothetical protein
MGLILATMRPFVRPFTVSTATVLTFSALPVAPFVTSHALALFAPPAAFGMFATSVFSHFGNFPLFAIASAFATSPTPVSGLLAIFPAVLHSCFIVPPTTTIVDFVVSFPAVVRHFVCSKLATLR